MAMMVSCSMLPFRVFQVPCTGRVMRKLSVQRPLRCRAQKKGTASTEPEDLTVAETAAMYVGTVTVPVTLWSEFALKTTGAI